MRRLLFILMLLLLPFRGWAADAMAIQMVLPGGMSHSMSHTAGAPSSGYEHHPAAAPADQPHDMTAAKAGGCNDVTADDTGVPDDHCMTCAMCQTCHSLAITLPPTIVAYAGQMTLLPVSVPHDFTSADNALGLKPPISRLP